MGVLLYMFVHCLCNYYFHSLIISWIISSYSVCDCNSKIIMLIRIISYTPKYIVRWLWNREALTELLKPSTAARGGLSRKTLCFIVKINWILACLIGCNLNQLWLIVIVSNISWERSIFEFLVICCASCFSIVCSRGGAHRTDWCMVKCRTFIIYSLL